MKTMFRRLLSLVLCVLMLAAILPGNFALADDGGSFSVSGGGALRVGGTLQLKANGTGEADTLVWSSDDTTIATVDQNGLVSGVALGETEIQVVRTYRDENDEVQVETRKAPVSVVTFHTVSFVIPDQYTYGEGIDAPTPEKQLIIEGQTAEMPEVPATPEGYRYFVEWHLGTVDGEAYKFDTPVTADITLYAEFSDKCLVSFENADGAIMHSASVSAGQTLANPNLEVVPPADHSFTGEWKIFGTDTTFKFGETEVTENLRLVPQFIHTYYVFFNSNGSSVPPILVGANQTIGSAPAMPARAGYTFNHWYLDNENTPFNFATTPITSTTVLTAKWTPKSVPYQVVCWLEKPNVSGDPGTNPNNYEYFQTVNSNALAGSTISAATVASGINIYVNSSDQFTTTSSSAVNRIATYSHGSSAVVAGTGTTVVNAYFKRVSFTLTFSLGTNGKMVKGAATYTGTQYTLTAKYGQSIVDAWPSSANATITNGTGSGNKFQSWAMTNIRSTAALATRRIVLDYALLPTSTNTTTATLAATYGSVTTIQANYWLEVDEGTPGAVFKTISGTDYYFRMDPDLSQSLDSSSGSLSQKAIIGYTAITYTGDNTTGVFNFYYKRQVYTLSFDTQVSGLPINPIGNLGYGTALAGSKPADPVAAGKTFLGWYYEVEYNTPVDWANAKMPNGNLKVFAKWEADALTANFYFDDTLKKLVHHAGTESGSSIADPNLYSIGEVYDVNGNIYDPDAGVELKGVFKGWYWFLPGSYNRERAAYSFETLVMEDITLFARWDVAGFTVTYSANGGTGTVPADSNTYAYGAGATVLSSSLSRPSYVFTGWQINGTGPAYYPGSVIRVTGDMTLVAQWTATSSVTTLVFNKNNAADPGTESWYPLARGGNVVLPGSSFFTRDDGYALIGWNTAANGNGTSYDLGAVYTLPNVASTTLYAMWAPSSYQVIYSAGTATDDPSLRDMPESPVTQGFKASVQVPSTIPTRFGMVFQGWGTNDLGTNGQILPAGTVFTMPAKNVTLTAIWKARAFTITFLDGYDGTEDVQDANALITKTSVPFGDSAKLITNLPSHPHWLFDKWVVVGADGSESALFETMLIYITSDLTLRAKWKPAPKYAVSYVDEDEVTPLADPIVESQGQPIPAFPGETPTKADKDGIAYTFDKWVLIAGTPGGGNTVGTTDLVYKATYKSAFIDYTVTYAWDGAAPDTASLPAQLTKKHIGDDIKIANDPAVTGWTFDGWYTKSGSVTVVSDDTNFTMPAADVTLYGKWTHNIHTVSYAWESALVPDGHDLPDSVSPSYYGDTITVAEDQSEPGWIFTGWHTQAGAAVNVGDSQASFTMPNDSVVLYGNWEKIPYTVTYMDENGTTILQQAITVTIGDEIPAYSGATPTKADANGIAYTFGGWTLMSGTLGAGNKVGATDLVYKATYTWDYIDYTVNYAWDGAAPVGANLPAPADGNHIGDEFTIAADPVVTGWTFNGWYTLSDAKVKVVASDETFTMPAADVTLYGSWTQNNYKVMYVYEGTVPAGAIALLPIGLANMHYGDTITVEDDPALDGYTFIGWHTKAGAGVTVGAEDETFTMPDGDVILYGQWAAIDYTVSYINWDDGLLYEISPVHIGDTVPLYPNTEPTPVKPDDNGHTFTFTGWTLVEGELIGGKVGKTDLVYRAQYDDALIDYTVTYAWDGADVPAGQSLPTQLTKKHVGDTITVAADPTETGWTFDGWYTKNGAVTVEADDAEFTMPAADITLYGKWTHKEHTVTYAWDSTDVPAGHTVPDALAGQYYGNTITVAADQSEPGWIFTGWHTGEGAAVTVLDNNASFVMPDDDVTLYGTWAKIDYTVTYRNWDGETLYTVDPVHIGDIIPSYVGATPVRPDANGSTFTFSYWQRTSGNPNAGDATKIGTESLVYTAVYTSELIPYTVSYAWEDGSPVPDGQTLPAQLTEKHYGDMITVAADSSEPGWVFTGWYTLAGAPVTVGADDATFQMRVGDVTLYGRWEKIPYTVTYVDENGATVLQNPITVTVGDAIPGYSQQTPTKADNNGIRYTFSEWVLLSGTHGGTAANPLVGTTDLVYKAVYSWDYIDYTVNYAWEGTPAPGANLPDAVEGNHVNEEFTIAADPVVTGWTFVGWYTLTGAPVVVGENDTKFQMPAAGVTLYGKWTQNNYTVGYAWDSALVPVGQTLPGVLENQHYGDTITVASDLSEPGWIFTGWHTGTNAAVTVGDSDASFTMPADDVILYGGWEKIPYTVTYVDEDGATVLQSAITANIGDAIPAYAGATPTKPDNNGITYTFGGWVLADGTEGANRTIGTTDLVYRATYGDAKIDYTVNYAWEGSAPSGATLPSQLTQKHIGDTITVAADPAVTGWTFNGWYTLEGAPVTVLANEGTFIMPASNVTLYGSWTQNDYRVSYGWAEGSLVPDGQQLPATLTERHYNDTITIAADPSEPGWVFTGWYTIAGALVTVGNSQATFTMPDGDVALYGHWEMVDYTVLYLDENDSTLQGPHTVNIGDLIPAYEGSTPTKADNNGTRYTFSGWSLTGQEGPVGTVGTTDLVYRATYSSNYIDYTVKYAWESGSPLPGNAAQLLPADQTEKHIGDTVTVEIDPISTGWTFIGWHTATGAPVTVGDSQASFTMPAADVTLYGRWTQNEYTVTYALEAGSPNAGVTLPTGETGKHYQDTITVAGDLSAAGWVFTGWHTASDAAVTVGDSDTSFTMPAANVTLYGSWEKLYTTTYVNYDDTVLQNGIERLAGEAIPAYEGQAPTKPDNNGVRYTFSGWTLVTGTAGDTQNTIVGTTDLVFKATYGDAFIDYTLRYAWESDSPLPGNAADLLPAAQSGKNVGMAIPIAADPMATGWTFDGWYTLEGAPVTVIASSTSFTMPAADVTLYGRWTQNNYTVSYAWDGTLYPTAGVTLPAAQNNQHYGDTITIVADPSLGGWSFEGWYTKTGSLVEVMAADSNFTMPDGNVTLYGKWKMIDYTVTFINYDNSVLQGPTTVHVGDSIPTYNSAVPTRPDDNGVSFTFADFMLEIGVLVDGKVGTTSIVFKARYSDSYIDYSVRYAWEGVYPTDAVLPGAVNDHHVNETITVATNPTATGWTFNGWFTKAGAPVTVTASTKTFRMPAANVDIYGTWTQNVYTVTYAWDGTAPANANALRPAQQTGLHYGDPVNVAQDLVLTGYIFEGWYTKSGSLVTVASDAASFTMPNGNVTLYGKWTQKNHTVQYTWDGTQPSGAVLPATLSNYHYGDTITMSTPKAVNGWLFLGWRTEGQSLVTVNMGDTKFVMPDGNVTLVGSWEKLYNVTYAWDRIGGAMVPPTAKLPTANTNQRAGTQITVASKPSINGWIFEGWYTKNANGAKVPLTVTSFVLGTENIVIYGMWTKIGVLTATAYNQPYDGSAHGIGIVSETGDKISYSLDGNNWTATPELRANVQSAETIYIKAEQAGYTTRTASATITITPRALSYGITAPETVYYGDGATVSYALTGFANGESLSNLPGLTAADLMPVSPVDKLTSANAELPYTVLIPTAVEKNANGSLKTFGNYAINPTDAAITVLPRPITLIVDDYEKFVGGDEPVYTYRVIGNTVNGDVLTAEAGRESDSRYPGEYQLRIMNAWINDLDAFENGNYVFTLQPALLTIKALPTFTLTFIVRGGPYGSAGLTVYTRELIQGLSIQAPDYAVPSGYTFSGFSNIPEKMPPHAVTIYGDLFGGPVEEALEEVEAEWIEDDTIPLSAPNYRAWSLVNLIVAMLTALGTVLILLGYIGKKKREADAAKGIRAAVINRKGGWRLASLIPGIGAIIVFLLTENMSDPMVLLDSWTPLMVVIALIQIGVAIFAAKKVTVIEPELAESEA